MRFNKLEIVINYLPPPAQAQAHPAQAQAQAQAHELPPPPLLPPQDEEDVDFGTGLVFSVIPEVKDVTSPITEEAKDCTPPTIEAAKSAPGREGREDLPGA